MSHSLETAHPPAAACDMHRQFHAYNTVYSDSESTAVSRTEYEIVQGDFGTQRIFQTFIDNVVEGGKVP